MRVDLPCLDLWVKKQDEVDIWIKAYPNGMGLQKVFRADYLDSNQCSGNMRFRKSVQRHAGEGKIPAEFSCVQSPWAQETLTYAWNCNSH